MKRFGFRQPTAAVVIVMAVVAVALLYAPHELLPAGTKEQALALLVMLGTAVAGLLRPLVRVERAEPEKAKDDQPEP